MKIKSTINACSILWRKKTYPLRVQVVEVLGQVLVSAFKLCQDAHHGKGNAFEQLFSQHFLLQFLDLFLAKHPEVELHLLRSHESSKLAYSQPGSLILPETPLHPSYHSGSVGFAVSESHFNVLDRVRERKLSLALLLPVW